MPIHDCFTGLRDRLGNKAGLLSSHAAHTTNTSAFVSVSSTAAEKTHKAQRGIPAATPVTPETPSSGDDIEYWREAYEERAAIYEFDGRHSRSEAEWLAMNDMLRHYSAAHNVSLGSDALHRFMCVLHMATGFNPQHKGA